MNEKYPQLFSPITFGGLTVRNRIVMPPMTTDLGDIDGFVTRRLIDYYEARAAGGCGLVIVEMACVDPPVGKGEYAELGIDDDKYIPGLADLAAAIKRQGAIAFQQIHHAGRKAYVPPGSGMVTVAPSAIAAPGGITPRELTNEEVKRLIRLYAEGAERVYKAGFDGVELHGAHIYLITQFLSALSNQRTDEFGGSLENRARFLLDIVRQIRQKLPDFPLCVRLASDEFTPGGITLEDSITVTRWLKEAGVTVMHVSTGTAYSLVATSAAAQCFPNGHFLHLAEGIRRAVGLPVIGVSRIKPAALAEQALREGQCDMVSIGRQQIADPLYATKVAEGREDDVRPCISCNICMQVTAVEDKPLVCTVNVAAGQERECVVAKAPVAKKVVVVGGGPAGLEAARVAAERGHEVHVFEHQTETGGQLQLAAVPPHKEELAALAGYLRLTAEKLGVTLHTGQDANVTAVLALKPDAVVIAAGAEPVAPPIPRAANGPRVVQAHEVLAKKEAVNGRIVVIGGGMVGSETAEYLATMPGTQVTVVEMLDGIALDMIPMWRVLLLTRLAQMGVQIVVKTKAKEIVADGLVVAGEDEQARLLPADLIVLATGARPNAGLRAELENRVAAIHVVGDASRPRRILEAIHEGAVAGMAI